MFWLSCHRTVATDTYMLDTSLKYFQTHRFFVRVQLDFLCEKIGFK